MPASSDAPATPPLQTLSRGIRALEVLADAGEPLSIGAVATRLGLHRSIAYRILRTLEDHGLVVRDAAGDVQLGPRMATLARSVSRDLQAVALPQLTAVANELTMTAFLAVLLAYKVGHQQFYVTWCALVACLPLVHSAEADRLGRLSLPYATFLSIFQLGFIALQPIYYRGPWVFIPNYVGIVSLGLALTQLWLFLRPAPALTPAASRPAS